MPELPEVEFARTCLARWWGGRRFTHVEADDTRLWRDSDRRRRSQLEGVVVRDVARRAKWLFVHPDAAGPTLALHLGMTGKLVRTSVDAVAPRWSRVRFETGDGSRVHFTDPRMFGRCLVGPREEVESIAGVSSLGPDALDAPPDVDAWFEGAIGSKRPVKSHLLDQSVVAGLGNIQVTEALWRAGVHPARAVGGLSRPDWERLRDGIAWTLRRTLDDLAGAETITYVEEAGAPNPFLAYGREGEPCPRCATVLEAMVLSGRTSIFCPRCQPPPRRK